MFGKASVYLRRIPYLVPAIVLLDYMLGLVTLKIGWLKRSRSTVKSSTLVHSQCSTCAVHALDDHIPILS